LELRADAIMDCRQEIGWKLVHSNAPALDCIQLLTASNCNRTLVKQRLKQSNVAKIMTSYDFNVSLLSQSFYLITSAQFFGGIETQLIPCG
jgi:hypothetical protein